MAFFMFILTSADAFCKKLFLFISYSNLFCIFFCIAILVCNALFPGLSETGTLYARNLVRTLLYLFAMLVYLKFLRPLCARSARDKEENLVFHFSGFNAVFSDFYIVCHTSLCGL